MESKDIIKALENYILKYGRNILVNNNVRIGNVYDLIKNQQAEIERLKKLKGGVQE